MSKDILVGHDEVRQRNWRDPSYRAEYRRQKPRYDLVRELLKLRHLYNLTQKQLAEMASTHQSRISRIESGEDDFRISTLVTIANALNSDVEIRLIPRPSREFYTAVVTSLDAQEIYRHTGEAWEISKASGVRVKRKLFAE